MVYDEGRLAIVDFIGRGRRLEVEILPKIEGGCFIAESGRQRLRIGHWRVPLPRLLAGHARVEERAVGGALAVRVAVSNPILGEFFGYEGTFRCA